MSAEIPIPRTENAVPSKEDFYTSVESATKSDESVLLNEVLIDGPSLDGLSALSKINQGSEEAERSKTIKTSAQEIKTQADQIETQLAGFEGKLATEENVAGVQAVIDQAKTVITNIPEETTSQAFVSTPTAEFQKAVAKVEETTEVGTRSITSERLADGILLSSLKSPAEAEPKTQEEIITTALDEIRTGPVEKRLPPDQLAQLDQILQEIPEAILVQRIGIILPAFARDSGRNFTDRFGDETEWLASNSESIRDLVPLILDYQKENPDSSLESIFASSRATEQFAFDLLAFQKEKGRKGTTQFAANENQAAPAEQAA